MLPSRGFGARLRQSLKFHYLWRSFFFDQLYALIMKASEKINRFSARLLLAYVIAIGALIVVNGITRLATAHSALWTEELVVWLLIGLCFIGSGLAIKKGLHIGITLFIEIAPVFAQRTLVFVGNFLVTAFLLCLVGISFISALEVWEKTGTALKIPLTIPYMQIPLSAILILIQMLPFFAGPLLKNTNPEKYLLTRNIPEGEQ
jgi:TRAP-type C4-dicarboxylate transport system permease small subunit